MIVTLTMNHDWTRNSLSWNGGRTTATSTSSMKAKRLPETRAGPVTTLMLMDGYALDSADAMAPGVVGRSSVNDPAGGVTPFSRHQAPASR